MSTTPEKLIFVYNANKGKLNALLEAAHKIVSPETYPCDLCKLTHGSLSESKVWKEYRKDSAIPFEFLYRDEFRKRMQLFDENEFALPVVFVEYPERMQILIAAKEFAALHTVDDLIDLVKERLPTAGL